MSFFDRLSNLGRGAIKSAFSGEEEPADPVARQLERLHKAYTTGILSESEYQAKRAALLGTVADPAPRAARTATTAPRTSIDPPAPDAAPAEDGSWPEEPPIKRTL
jgi:hypothetical protein